MPLETGVSGAGGAGSIEVTAPDGDALAKEDGGNLEQLAATTFEGEGPPIEPQRKIAAYVTGEVTTIPGQTFASAGAAAANPGGLPGTFVAGTVDQGAAHPTQRWGVSDQAAQDIQREIETAVQAVETELQDKATEATAQAIEDAVDELESDADATRIAVQSIDAKTPELVGGRVPVTVDPPYDTAPGRTSTDALVIAAREVLMNNVNEYALDTRVWGTSTANGGSVTYDTATGQTVLSVTGVSGSSAVMQTHTYFPYEPGATSHPVMTLVHADAGQVNQVRRWGMFSTTDGLFYELAGTTLRMMRRSSTSGAPVDTLIAEQANWVDPFPGLNLGFIQRWALDFQWLSAGKVKAIINDEVRHWLDFGDTIAVPYMRTAQLPLRIEIANTGASVASSVRYICSTVYLLGGTELKVKPELYGMSAPRSGVTTTPTPLLGLRIAGTLSGRANRSIVLPVGSTVTNESGAGTVRLVFNPTSITGGSWALTDSTHGVEYNEGITSITGGTPAGHVILPTSAGSTELDNSKFFSLNGAHLRLAFDGTQDTIVFMGNARVGTVTLDIVARWLRVAAS